VSGLDERRFPADIAQSRLVLSTGGQKANGHVHGNSRMSTSLGSAQALLRRTS
jgi:hypothetical protein